MKRILICFLLLISMLWVQITLSRWLAPVLFLWFFVLINYFHVLIVFFLEPAGVLWHLQGRVIGRIVIHKHLRFHLILRNAQRKWLPSIIRVSHPWEYNRLVERRLATRSRIDEHTKRIKDSIGITKWS